MLPYSVVDTETTIRNKGEQAVGGFSGSPFHPDNFIVSLGELVSSGSYRHSYSTSGTHKLPHFLRRAKYHPVMVVGHNLAFDWQYFYKTWPEAMREAEPNLYIWDTQQVEYLLSGQSELYPSLDHCSAKRGLPLKDDKIKEYWDQGVDTIYIPKSELLEYMEQDVRNTHAVFLDQYQKVRANLSLWELVKVKMDDLLATIEMTRNGMRFDLEYALEQLGELDKQREVLYTKLREMGQPMFPMEFDLLSPQHMSCFLFGGTLKMEERVVVKNAEGTPVIFKGGQKKGQIKTRLEKVEKRIKGLGIKPSLYDIPKGKAGFYSTDSEYLQLIEHPVIVDLLKYRELEKDVTTYFKGYSQHVWFDGCIHPRINQEATRTGRQSSSDPNLQNVSKDDE